MFLYGSCNLSCLSAPPHPPQADEDLEESLRLPKNKTFLTLPQLHKKRIEDK